jgi:hypothetical protein
MKLPGVASLEAKLDAQNAATMQHREYEGNVLGALQAEAVEIKTLAQRTDERVTKHDIELAVIKEAERQALIVEAARTKAETDRVSTRRSWKQLAVSAVAGAAGLLIVSLLVFYLTNSGVQ